MRGNRTAVVAGLCLAWCFAAPAFAAEVLIRSDKPNAVTFPAENARFVRLVIQATSGSEPCIDELEVYAEKGSRNLALAKHGAKATASSCMPANPKHRIEHLNDGLYGNEYSWIAAGSAGQWARIELAEPAKVSKVVFSRDRNRQYSDRVPVRCEVQLSPDGKQWKTVKKVAGKAASVVLRRRQHAGFAGDVPGPPPPPRVSQGKVVQSKSKVDEQLEYAFLGEEHAWLKAYGRADLAQRLLHTPYPEKRYPPHVGADRLPLAPLAGEPKLDGILDDACWTGASRGVVRVADPYDFDAGPLVTCAVRAGHKDGSLLLALQTNRLLSSHIAVVSTSTGDGCGVVAYTKKGLVFNTYEPEGRHKFKLKQSTPVEGTFDKTLTCCEIRLPLKLFPDCQTQGIRVGLGMGGRHTLWTATGRTSGRFPLRP